MNLFCIIKTHYSTTDQDAITMQYLYDDNSNETKYFIFNYAELVTSVNQCCCNQTKYSISRAGFGCGMWGIKLLTNNTFVKLIVISVRTWIISAIYFNNTLCLRTFTIFNIYIEGDYRLGRQSLGVGFLC